MGFGIVDLLKNLSLKTFFLILKRKKDLFNYKKLNLTLPLNYNISGTNFGKDVCIGQNVSLVNSTIGDNSYINNDSKILNTTIGKFCSIGPNVKIVLGRHPINYVSTHPAFYSTNKPFKTYSDKTYFIEYSSVEIGNDVWIGEGVLIPGGVKIGNGAIITSRAVVTKDVEPYSIVGGIPSKHIKYRFDNELIKKINDSEWWNWDKKSLEENFLIFQDPINFMKHFNL